MGLRMCEASRMMANGYVCCCMAYFSEHRCWRRWRRSFFFFFFFPFFCPFSTDFLISLANRFRAPKLRLSPFRVQSTDTVLETDPIMVGQSDAACTLLSYAYLIRNKVSARTRCTLNNGSCLNFPWSDRLLVAQFCFPSHFSRLAGSFVAVAVVVVLSVLRYRELKFTRTPCFFCKLHARRI